MAVKTTHSRELWFGWQRYRPKLLQVLNTPRWFLFFLCTYVFTQSIIVNGIYSVSITTIERRYRYSSLMTGFLTSTCSAALLFTPLVSYLGATRKKPLICGTGMLIMGLGFLIFTLPHFISDNYKYGSPVDTVDSLCSAKNTSILAALEARKCNKTQQKNWGYYFLFVVGYFVTGMGGTPMWALGASYIDENVKKKVFSMYIGVYFSTVVVGAGVGFVLGALCLSMYVDLGVQTPLTPKDERWVGAWWLGFVVCTALCVVFSVWLMAFPKEFPITRERRETEKEKQCSTYNAPLGYAKLKEIHKATRFLLSRVTYITVTLAACLEAGLTTAMVTFLPKIIQQQFRYPASLVSLIFGATVLPAALSGNIIGSLLCKKLKVGPNGAAKMCCITSFVSLLMCCFLFLYCDTLSIAGVNTPYKNSTTYSASSWCNLKCACSQAEYSPVCGDGVTFLSACHAGCTVKHSNKTLSNCSCIGSGAVTTGSCNSSCPISKLVISLLIYFLLAFTTFHLATPNTVVTLRCVPEDQRAYSLGIQATLGSLVGNIPGPIIVGRLIDSTCILWNTECGLKGNCIEYNNKGLMIVVIGFCVVIKLLSTLCYFVAHLFCPKEETKEQSNGNEWKQVFLKDEARETNSNRLLELS